MKEQICQVASKEKLVAYADGDLSPSETDRIAEHIASCSDCQAVTEALERSLQVTQTIWQTGQAQWPKTHPLEVFQSSKWSFRKVATVAASILLVLWAGAVWRMLSRLTERAGISREQALAVEIKRKIADSGDAARLLASAELLSKYPEAEKDVKQRYQHIVEKYPETAAAAKARKKIQ
ncbi:MAG TPA: zf-HC2 domain-containing protein [Sedimentisphaerales bacterium]|nr:zf-HC2 domain-containing protein [Sedimentisphaerales bacterium]